MGMMKYSFAYGNCLPLRNIQNTAQKKTDQQLVTILLISY